MYDTDEYPGFLARQIYKDRGRNALRYVSSKLARSINEEDIVGAEAWYRVARVIVEIKRADRH